MTQLRNGNDTQYMVIKVERADFINCNKVSKRISLKLYKEPGGVKVIDIILFVSPFSPMKVKVKGCKVLFPLFVISIPSHFVGLCNICMLKDLLEH